MSRKHPVIAVTGSSGAGTTTVKRVFENIFRREGIRPAVIEGDAFHRFSRQEMKERIAQGDLEGRAVSHFGPDTNEWALLEQQFRAYGQGGRCRSRYYLHSPEEAEPYQQEPGTFTPWVETPADTDLLFYEGLHGCVKTESIDMVRHADLKIGVVPIINLEWIQKIHRDTRDRGYSKEAVSDVILRRMHDYVHYIVPQFGETDINFQRVPVVDTSNPFIARDIPTAGESLTVIRFKNPRGIDFPYLLSMIDNSFMSRANTIVVPGGKMDLAMQLILTPMILRLMEIRRAQLQ
ncbi:MULTISPECIES: phosphoribulokinase [Methylibium]|uniref:Phosphoribulokinase n=1 Tax=Methylibium petroleiphilum (strain ATCC BAA-1232 / LMG 22953 / PM1) TaxID=420662 RepID=A2SFV5_METPP|nr:MULTISPECIES: phosphoribulokinase [Methylibium]ABM94444.1 phosphoribulokinase [Methylibium petroleiphilum PM1]EWS54857.1 Phosphoribulokinase, chromosomal [Methylibium sp. T29]EWS60197.1 Phosphoribulokinase, chromosomal [Methylibium sp. T29-B]MBN9203050.1 phosphoribulokinase [Methylibium petroleiphilum]